MSNIIQPMNTLDRFGGRELAKLNKLIHAYANSGRTIDGKRYAELPATWYDDGVYPDFNANSGSVFLTNSEYQALVNTEYGLMTYYNTPYGGHEGTLFDLADEVNDDLSDNEGNTTLAGADKWHKDDLNAVFGYLDADIAALRGTGADLTYLYRVKDRIVEAFILMSLTDDPLNQAELGDYSDAELIDRCLFDFEHVITDDGDYAKYVGFIRSTIKG